MSSSPSAWTPQDLRANAPSTTPERRDGGIQKHALFEVDTPAGVPERLLAPARAAAHAEGYAAGWADGMRAARDRVAADAERARAEHEQLLAERREGIARALAALDAAADALERQAMPGVAELERLLLDAGYAIAEALVGHSLRDDRTRAPAALARVLALAPVGEPVTVRLHPDDHAVVAAIELADDTGREINLLPDPDLEPGDAVATSGATEVDARIRAGLARIREALGR